MRRKALLINPPTGLYIREDRCQAPLKGMAATSARPPLDLAYMAATLESSGVECRIRDYPVEGLGWDDLARDLEDFAPDFLFVSVTSFTITDDLKVCRFAREKLGAALVIVAKGAHVAVKADEVLRNTPELDAAIRDEYEIAAKELASGADWSGIAGVTFRDRKTGSIVATPPRPHLEDLDSLPYPARHLMNNDLYQRPDTGKPQTTVQTNRGCPSSCVFCLGPTVYGRRVRARSPANIVGELRECVTRFGIEDFFFRADTFTFQKAWVMELCREIVDSGLKIRWVCNSRVDTIDDERLVWMKAAGCHGVAFGIESGDQESLDLMRKGTTLEKCREAVRLVRKHGLKSLLYFVIGFPWDTAETIERSISFASELGGDFVEFHSAIPFPGTALAEMAEREGLFVSESLSGYDYSRPPLKTRSLSAIQLEALRRRAFLRLYVGPRGLMRLARTLLRHTRSPAQLVRMLSFGARKLISLIHAREESR